MTKVGSSHAQGHPGTKPWYISTSKHLACLLWAHHSMWNASPSFTGTLAIFRGKYGLCGNLLTVWSLSPELVLNPDPRCALGIPSFQWHIKMRSSPHGTITDRTTLLVRPEARPLTYSKVSASRVKFQLLKTLPYSIDCSIICPKDWLACSGGHLLVNIFVFSRGGCISAVDFGPLCKIS